MSLWMSISLGLAITISLFFPEAFATEKILRFKETPTRELVGERCQWIWAPEDLKTTLQDGVTIQRPIYMIEAKRACRHAPVERLVKEQVASQFFSVYTEEEIKGMLLERDTALEKRLKSIEADIKSSASTIDTRLNSRITNEVLGAIAEIPNKVLTENIKEQLSTSVAVRLTKVIEEMRTKIKKDVLCEIASQNPNLGITCE